MSATNRGAERREADHYPTPEAVTLALVDALDLPEGLWLEPAVGEGAIVRAVERARPGRQRWIACEIRDVATPPHIDGSDLFRGDFLRLDLLGPRPDVVISNPPYSLALPFVEKALRVAAGRAWVVMLLRLGFLESKARASFLAAHPPDVYPLAERPSFTGHGTDSAAYGWFAWPPGEVRQHGRLFPPLSWRRRAS